MTTKYQMTRAEEALGRILDEVGTTLSEPAHDLLSEAMGAAYAAWLSPNSPLQPEEYEETDKKLCSAAAKVTDQDRELLAEVARAHKAASDSIDPDDDRPRVWSVSSVLSRILQYGVRLDRRGPRRNTHAVDASGATSTIAISCASLPTKETRH